MRINTALILCAGFGKRLNPLTLDTPKPLIKLNKISILETCIDLIESLGIKNIEEHENRILEYGIEKLKRNNSINIIGNPKNRGSVMSFTIKGIHPHDIATILDDDGVAIRAGHHCCQILHDKLGIPATARASIGVYNTKEDIDILCKAIENCKKVFQG